MAFDKAADQGLWSAVVWQALNDAATLPLGSPQYDEAIGFLTSQRPYWRQARTEVAAHLDLHEDHIRRAAEKFLAADPRAARERLVETYRRKSADAALPRYDQTEPVSQYLREILKLRHHSAPRRRSAA